MKYPFMPLFLGDLLADTLHLSTQEFGAYMLLIAHAWKHDAKIAVKDLRQVTRVSRYQWPKISQKICKFFDTTMETNFWIQLRVKTELENAAEISEKRRDAALQMHAKHHAKASHPHSHINIDSSNGKKDSNAKPMQTHQPYTPSGVSPDKGNDYRSPPRTKSDNVLKPIPDKSQE